MPAAQIKDYYTILELPPAAVAEDIKKAYRTLAFKYHPDTNPDNSFAAAHFLEIQEAYSVLSHEHKRRKYDEERWLNGMSNRAKGRHVVTPDWILMESKKLRLHMATVDTYRMSHSALYDYVLLLLSDSHMAVLQEHGETDINKLIVQELLQSIRHLKYMYMQPLGDRFAKLVYADNETLIAIHRQQNRSYRQALWERYMPLVIILATILLVIMMLLWARK